MPLMLFCGTAVFTLIALLIKAGASANVALLIILKLLSEWIREMLISVSSSALPTKLSIVSCDAREGGDDAGD